MRTNIFKIAIVFILVLPCSSSHAEPTFQKPSHTDYILGGSNIRFPLPDHFVDGALRSSLVKQLSDLGNPPNMDILGTYLDEGDLIRFDSSETPLPLWTKVGILKRLREVDVSQSDLAKIKTDALAKQTDVFDPANPKFQAMMQRLNSGASRLPNGGFSYDLPKAVNLGIIENGNSSFSVMMLISPSFKSGEVSESVPMLSAITYIICNKRLLIVNTTQRFKSTNDIDSLKRFISSWSLKIVTENQ